MYITGPAEGTKIWGEALYNLDRLEHFVKAPLYSIWEILGGPVAPLAPPGSACPEHVHGFFYKHFFSYF